MHNIEVVLDESLVWLHSPVVSSCWVWHLVTQGVFRLQLQYVTQQGIVSWCVVLKQSVLCSCLDPETWVLAQVSDARGGAAQLSARSCWFISHHTLERTKKKKRIKRSVLGHARFGLKSNGALNRHMLHKPCSSCCSPHIPKMGPSANRYRFSVSDILHLVFTAAVISSIAYGTCP